MRLFNTFVLATFFLVGGFVTAYAENTECSGFSNEASQESFENGYNYSFSTLGNEVTVSFELLDDKEGVVAFFWNLTNGLQETQMNPVGNKSFSLTLSDQQVGEEIKLACKFAFAGGMAVTKEFIYTVGNNCGGSEEPDDEAPVNFTAVLGEVTAFSVELLLNATDNSGVVIYEIAYGETQKSVTGVSGEQQSYIVSGLESSTHYTFSISAKDAAGNIADNSPLTVEATTLENFNTECTGIDSEASDGSFETGYRYNFATVGNDVVITFEMLDEKVGLVAYVFDKTVGFVEYPMDHLEGQSFTYTLEGYEAGQELTLACKFAFAGGAAITKDFLYTVGNNCGGSEEPDEEAPMDFTATLGEVSAFSVELLLNATDNSGVVIYEIVYGETQRSVTGTSGVQQSYVLNGLEPFTNYSFSISAKDVAGNVAANSPLIVEATTLENFNTECAGIDSEASEGSFETGYRYEFTTVGTDVVATVEMLDDKEGLVSYLFDRTEGLQEFRMAEVGNKTFSYTLEGYGLGQELILAFKIEFAGGMAITKNLPYTVGNNCSDTPEPDEEAPTDFTAVLGNITSSTVELLLTANDNSGSVIYTISYGDITKTTSGLSGTEKSYIVDGLQGNTAYTFTITAKDAAGNEAENNPLVINAKTLEQVSECNGEKGHFGTPDVHQIRFEIATIENGNVVMQITPLEAGRTIEFAEAHTTAGNEEMTIAANHLSATATFTGIQTDEVMGIRFLYRLNDMPGNEMTAETVELSDPNIIFYVAGSCKTNSIFSAEEIKMTVAPNPFTTHLTITAETGIETIELYSLYGQQLKLIDGGNSKEVVLPLQELSNGVYVISVTDANGQTMTHKVVRR